MLKSINSRTWNSEVFLLTETKQNETNLILETERKVCKKITQTASYASLMFQNASVIGFFLALHQLTYGGITASHLPEASTTENTFYKRKCDCILISLLTSRKKDDITNDFAQHQILIAERHFICMTVNFLNTRLTRSSSQATLVEIGKEGCHAESQPVTPQLRESLPPQLWGGGGDRQPVLSRL